MLATRALAAAFCLLALFLPQVDALEPTTPAVVIRKTDPNAPPSITVVPFLGCTTGWYAPAVGGWTGWAGCGTIERTCALPSVFVKADMGTVTGEVRCSIGGVNPSTPTVSATAVAPNAHAEASNHVSQNSFRWYCYAHFGTSGTGTVVCPLPV